MTTYATTDPTTGLLVREFPPMTDQEVEAALAQALTAYRSWSLTPLTERAALLERVADLHRTHATELAELMTLEMGKPIAQSRAEVELAASIYAYHATQGPGLLADEEVQHAGQ